MSSPTKTDNYPTSYFFDSVKQDLPLNKKVAEMAKKEREDYIAQVKYKKSAEYKKTIFRPRFKPAGLQEKKDLYKHLKLATTNTQLNIKNQLQRRGTECFESTKRNIRLSQKSPTSKQTL